MPENLLVSFSIIKRGRTTFYVKNKYKDVLLNLDIDSLRKEAIGKGDIRSGREPHAVVHIPELAKERIIIRHSRHGGLFGYIAGDIYCKKNRFVNELIASETAIEKGVNTAEIIAVIKHRAFGPFYHIDVLSKEIPDSLDLVELLTKPPQRLKFNDRKNIIEVVAQTIRKMHDAGLYHTDLHLKNILIQHTPDSSFKAYIIDMDKAKTMDVMSTKLRMRNLIRLDRSVEKLKALLKSKAGGMDKLVCPWTSKADKLRFLMAYTGGDIKMRQYIRMQTNTYWLHKLLWYLGLP